MIRLANAKAPETSRKIPTISNYEITDHVDSHAAEAGLKFKGKTGTIF
jgi:hypothetical protein